MEEIRVTENTINVISNITVSSRSNAGPNINKVNKVIRVYEAILESEANPDNINLSSGDPFFSPPAHLKKTYQNIIEKMIFDGSNDFQNNSELNRYDRIHLNKYRIMPMIVPSLLQAAYKHFIKNGIPVKYGNDELDPKKIEITVGTGTTQLCMAAIYVLTEANDGILTPWPCYGLFNMVAQITGNPFYFIDPDCNNDFKINPLLLEKSLADHPNIKCILISNPNNPIGSVYSKKEYESLVQILNKPQYLHIKIIVDEVYENTLLDESCEFVSLASLSGMYDRVITITGVSKNSGLAKERIGIACGNAKIIWEMTSYIMKSTGGLPELSQIVAASAIENTGIEYYKKNARYYSMNLTFVVNIMNEINNSINKHYNTSNMVYVALVNLPKAGFFLCLRFPILCGKKDANGFLMKNDFDAFNFFLKYANITSVPCSTLGFPEDEMVLRISLAVSQVNLVQAFKNIREAIYFLLKNNE